jgi:hypothetical protein
MDHWNVGKLQTPCGQQAERGILTESAKASRCVKESDGLITDPWLGMAFHLMIDPGNTPFPLESKPSMDNPLFYCERWFSFKVSHVL